MRPLQSALTAACYTVWYLEWPSVGKLLVRPLGSPISVIDTLIWLWWLVQVWSCEGRREVSHCRASPNNTAFVTWRGVARLQLRCGMVWSQWAATLCHRHASPNDFSKRLISCATGCVPCVRPSSDCYIVVIVACIMSSSVEFFCWCTLCTLLFTVP